MKWTCTVTWRRKTELENTVWARCVFEAAFHRNALNYFSWVGKFHLFSTYLTAAVTLSVRKTLSDLIMRAIDIDAASLEDAMAKMKGKTVLLLDGCDAWLCSMNFSFNSAIAELLQNFPNLIILATARSGLFETINPVVRSREVSPQVSSRALNKRRLSAGKVSSCAEIIIPILRLSLYDSAQFFCICCPRELQMTEMHGGLFLDDEKEYVDPLEAFGESSIVKAFNGLPSVIEEVAMEVQKKNLIVDEDNILNVVIPEANSTVRCNGVWKSACGKIGVKWGKWSDIGYWLMRDFDEVMADIGGVGRVRRRLSVKCLDMMSGECRVTRNVRICF